MSTFNKYNSIVYSKPTVRRSILQHKLKSRQYVQRHAIFFLGFLM